VKLPFQISAGEFFELIRPAVLLLSVLLSILVLLVARKRGSRLLAALAWALATLFLPLVVLPLYLAILILNKRIQGVDSKPSWSFLFIPLYSLLALSLTAGYVYLDYRSVDSHLARAAQAKVSNDQSRTIREYRTALTLEDNPHTHKLLAIELESAGELDSALTEFRLAEKGGEPDDSIPFRLAGLLEKLSKPGEAAQEYERYLASGACNRAEPDALCESARQNLLALRTRK
jgi:hypothetical protein